jgi:Domain of unknown function (DUF927)/Toprim domain
MSSERWVATRALQEAVKRRESDVLQALGIPWDDGAGHITCPYPDHADDHPSWRWDDRKARAHCTCVDRSHSIFDVVMRREGIDFEAAKLRVAEILGRHDLIRARDGERYQAMDAASLLRPPADQRDDQLAQAYPAFRLGTPPDEVPMPSTPVAGWRALAYYDPPGRKGGKPKLVGHFPCVVFGTVAPDGRRHAHRIYVAPGGQGKAELGTRSDGRPRDPKKSAKLRDGQSAAGCAVLWGAPAIARHLVLAEGIETAAALAFAHRAEIEANELAIAAALSASGISSFEPWPVTRRVTVAADRDEGRPADDRGHRAGERAAREFALRHHEQLEVQIALPGQPGEDIDWLDVLRREGVDAVRAGLQAAPRYVPTSREIEDARRHASRVAELAEIERIYPLPAMESLSLAYRHTQAAKVMIHRYAGKDEEKNDIWLPIATPLGVPARLRAVDQQGAYGLRVTVRGMDGQPRAVEFDRAGLARMGASEIRAHLFAAGLRVEHDGEVVAVQALKAADPSVEIVVVSRPGWHRLPELADPVFITPGSEVFGAPDDCALELAANARLADPCKAGTIEGWSAAVEAALAAPDCPHWLIGLAAGFAGTIAALTGLDTCGVNLSGISSSGKTLAQKLAASVWGSPRLGVGLLQSMRTTENALESLAQASSGTVLALDEVAHVDGRVVGRMIYSIASGIGKARLNAQATLRGRYVWQTFVLFSSECGLEAKIRGDGGAWLAGMAVRLADVDITGVNRAIDQSTLDAIGGIEHHFGHAGPTFVHRLITDGHLRNPEELRRQVNRAAGVIAQEAVGTRIRAATPFALLLVAGELAKALDIIPAADVRKAVLWAWERYLGSSEAVALDPAEQVLSHLRTWIAERWDVTVKSVDAAWDDPDGRRVNNRETVAWYDADAVYIPTTRLREAAGNVLTEREIAQALDKQGLLARRNDSRRIALRRVPNVGRVDAYALRRDQFGRAAVGYRPDLEVHQGGLR